MENSGERKWSNFQSGITRKVSFMDNDENILKAIDIHEEYQYLDAKAALILTLVDRIEELEKENSEIQMRLSRDYSNILNQVHSRINKLENDLDVRLRNRGM